MLKDVMLAEKTVRRIALSEPFVVQQQLLPSMDKVDYKPMGLIKDGHVIRWALVVAPRKAKLCERTQCV